MFYYLLTAAQKCINEGRKYITELKKRGHKHNSATLSISIGRQLVVNSSQFPKLGLDLPLGMFGQEIDVLVAYERCTLTFLSNFLDKFEERLNLMLSPAPGKRSAMHYISDQMRVVKDRVLEFFDPVLSWLRPVYFRPHDKCRAVVLPRKGKEVQEVQHTNPPKVLVLQKLPTKRTIVIRDQQKPRAEKVRISSPPPRLPRPSYLFRPQHRCAPVHL